MASFLLFLRAGRKRSQGKRSAPEREAVGGQVCLVGLCMALGPEQQEGRWCGVGAPKPPSAKADLGPEHDLWTAETPVAAQAPPGGGEVQNPRGPLLR